MVRSLSRDGRIFFAVNLAFSLGMSMYSFVLPAYARSLGATPAQFGALVSGAVALGTLSVIPGGIWADRYDRRTLMIIGWGICLPTPLLFAAAPGWTWLIPGYLCFFLSFFCNPAINAYISAIADPKRIGAVWGVINSAFPLGFIVGPVVGSAIIGAVGIRFVFIGAFACYLVSFALLFLLSPQPSQAARPAASRPARVSEPGSQPGSEPGSEPARVEQPPALPLSALPSPALPSSAVRAGEVQQADWRRSLVGIAAMFAGFYLLTGIGQSYIALYLQDSAGLELSGIGIFGSAAALGGFIGAPLIGRLRDRSGPRPAILASLGLISLAYAGLLALTWPPALFLALTMRGGENGMFSLGQAEVATRSPRHELGRAFAAFNVMTGIGSTLGPYIGGLTYEIDARLPFLMIIAGCAVLAAVSRFVVAAPGGATGPAAPELAQGQQAV